MTPTSLIILTGLILFWGKSLQNVLKHRGTTNHDTTQTPMSQGFILALLGSLTMFATSLALISLDLTGGINLSQSPVTYLGSALFLVGSILHAWSVHVRGKNAVSWSMPEDHRLITDPPYSYVRHPSYLAYFLMIIGVTLTWRTWFTLLPWVAIPGYIAASRKEEEYLIERFGDEYRRYMKRVGAFIPRI